MTEPRRVPLTKDRVLRAAMTVADRGGIAALTIRSVAAELAVKPMSLYHHVPNKEAIIDGVIDVVFGEIALPRTDTDWRTALTERARSARAVLRRHPWATPFMESRSRPGPATLRHHDAVLGTLIEGGFPLVLAGHAYSLMDCYIYGFALEEAALPFTRENLDDAMDGYLSQFQADEYPHLVRFAAERVLRPGYDYAHEFDYGLDLILDGLARELDRAVSP